MAGPLGHGLTIRHSYVNRNDTCRIPDCVVYHLSRKSLSERAVRTNDFHEDESLEPEQARSLPKDYIGTGFDRAA